MHQITLTLPDNLYQPVHRVARAINKTVETVLLTVLNASLPPLDGLSSDLAGELTEMETQDTDDLRKILFETVPQDQQEMLDLLLHRNQVDTLNEAEQRKLAAVQQAADRVMLRKARAAVLLRFRGERLPTLDELRRLTMAER